MENENETEDFFSVSSPPPISHRFREGESRNKMPGVGGKRRSKDYITLCAQNK